MNWKIKPAELMIHHLFFLPQRFDWLLGAHPVFDHLPVAFPTMSELFYLFFLTAVRLPLSLSSLINTPNDTK